MDSIPKYPDFKPVEFTDHDKISDVLWHYQPEISELTFTNLFMWRQHYHYMWCMMEQWLLIIAAPENSQIFALEPVGPPPRDKPVDTIFSWLSHQNIKDPEILRADHNILNELQKSEKYLFTPQREHFDYLYSTRDMIGLSGRNYHSKRNHLSRFLEKYKITYKPISDADIPTCLEYASNWCQIHHCSKSRSLFDEYIAIREALTRFRDFSLIGAAIYINNRLEAFTIAEMLNETTAVIHIEKASPQFHGIYTAINQLFCGHQLARTTYVNREQDLGHEGLRKSKLSYHPVRLIEKFSIRQKN